MDEWMGGWTEGQTDGRMDYNKERMGALLCHN